MPLKAAASISVRDSQTLLVTAFDPSVRFDPSSDSKATTATICSMSEMQCLKVQLILCSTRIQALVLLMLQQL
jgi:hypothetical protein